MDEQILPQQWATSGRTLRRCHHPLAAAATLVLVSCTVPDPNLDPSGSTDTGAPTSEGSSTEAPSETGSATETTEADPSSSGDTSSSDSTDGPTATLDAQDDGPYLVMSNALLRVSAGQGVLSNDAVSDGSGLVVTAFDRTGTQGGTISVADDGSFSYDPPTTLPFGTDRFSYTVTSASGAEASATVRVVVQAQDGTVDLDALGTQGVIFEGPIIDGMAGIAVSSAGDFDGDGLHDVLIGASHEIFHDGEDGLPGDAYLVLGSDALAPVIDLATADVHFEGVFPRDGAGHSASPAGDVNGDGLHDLLIGAPSTYWPIPGETYLVLGRAAPAANFLLETADTRIQGVANQGWAGISVSGACDVNGDGFSDILIGAPSTFGGGSAGEAFLLYGAPALPATVSLANADIGFSGRFVEDAFGTNVSCAGDINGDGYADLMVGADYASPNGLFPGDPQARTRAGETYLVYGGPALPSSIGWNDADVTFEGTDPFDFSGSSVSGAGDVDGDGFADILIADASAAAHLVYGGPALPATVDLADADVRIEAGPLPGSTGARVSGAGDFDGDGFADIFVGPTNLLIRGSDTLPPVIDVAMAALQLVGPSSSVGHAGDVDGDGFSDILVGNPLAMPGGTSNAGDARLVFGDDLTGITTVLGTDADDVLMAVGGAAADRLVAGQGNDVLHGDGGPDVLRGGQGDDVLHIADADFMVLDGGLGTDTIAVPAGLTLDLASTGDTRTIDIERIALAEDGASSLVIGELDVLNISTVSNELEISGDADDTVTLSSGVWSGPSPDGAFVVYMSTTTAARIRVAADITVLP